MPDHRDPPPTDEGWFALHDFRRIDWDAWQAASEADRERAIDGGVAHLQDLVDVADADEGATGIYSILGHKADLLLVHLRPTTAHLDAAARRFERTALARFSDQPTSYVSVTEASGYSERAREYFEGDLDEDSGLANYIRSRLYPTIPDVEHVCFYPMDKRREPEQNWYALPFDERAEHMHAHGEIGRDYGGRVTQMITGSVGLDDWEWGVTLWADDLVDVKDLLYEMRFDPSTAEFAEFGPFYVGRRIAPDDLSALLAGEAVPADGDVEVDAVGTGDRPVAGGGRSGSADAAGGRSAGGRADGRAGSDAGAARSDASAARSDTGAAGSDAGAARSGSGAARSDSGADRGDSGADRAGGPPAAVEDAGGGDLEAVDAEDMRGRLVSLGLHDAVDAGTSHHGVVCYSGADAQELAAEVEDLREQFEHYDTHVETAVRAQGGRSAVTSIWETEQAADTAAGFLTDLPGVTESVTGPLGDGAPDDAEEEATDPEADAASIREELADLDVYAGRPHGEDVYALVVYSDADRDDLTAAVEDLREGFDRYDTHEGTAVYAAVDGDAAAVVSLWATGDAADTASEYLADLPGIVGWADDREGFGTMGMFYAVKPEHREDFVATFEEVGDLLADTDGHRETSLLANVDDENDMFIASQWDAKEDAMDFFRSDAFGDTVEWGRDVLADRPRHVFLA